MIIMIKLAFYVFAIVFVVINLIISVVVITIFAVVEVIRGSDSDNL